MKKFFIFGAVAIVLSFAVALSVKAYNTTHNTLFYANLEALANPEGDNEGGGDGGGTNPGGGGTSPGEEGGSKGYGLYIGGNCIITYPDGSQKEGMNCNCVEGPMASCASGCLTWADLH